MALPSYPLDVQDLLLRPAPPARDPAVIPPDVASFVRAKLQPTNADPTTADEIAGALARDRERATNNLFASNLDRAAAMMRGERAGPIALPAVDDNVKAYVMKRQAAQQDQAHAMAQQKARLDALKAGADIYKTQAEVGKIGADTEKSRAETGKIGEEASGLRRKNEPATPALRQFASVLGLDAPEGATNAELKDMIDPYLKKAGIDVDWAKVEIEKGKAGQSKGQSVQNLRQEFLGRPEVKDTQTLASMFQKVKSTSDTGAGDISLVFAYMKMLDPGSTVREGEYATAANAGSVPQSILAAYNRALSGEKLAPGVRSQFKSEAQKLYDAQLTRYRPVAAQYRRLAGEAGYSPGDVVLDTGLDAPGDTVRVRFQGKVLEIPSGDLAAAVKDGAEEVR